MRYSIAQKIIEENEFQFMADKIASANNLESLFKIWNTAHKAEKEYKECQKATLPKGIFTDAEKFKTSFCWDGLTSLKGNVIQSKTNQQADVLFVLKESNSGGTPTLFEEKKFWFNDTAAKPQTKSQEERRSYSIRCTYARKFAQTLKCLNKPENQPFAYMSFNKRGGFGGTNYCRLKNYTAKYKKFILKQIQLHNPKVILFCGCYNDIAQILFNTDKNKNSIKQWNNKPVDIIFNQKQIQLFCVYHPVYNRFDESLFKTVSFPL